ncbi:hypothetical protein VP01_15081g1, partial [Puccinia sorghi]
FVCQTLKVRTNFNLTSLFRKDTPFLFTEQASKYELTQTLIETDTSDYAVTGVISQ